MNRISARFVVVVLAFVVSVVQAQVPTLYARNNVLAAGNYNDGPGSSDMTLTIRVLAGATALVNEGHAVKYVTPTEDYPGWTTLNYDDSAWQDGRSSVGFADGDDNTVVPAGQLAIYTRYRFDAPTPVNQLTVNVDFDDTYIIWLNGVEIGRHSGMNPHAPAGTVPAFNVAAAGLGFNHESSNLAAGTPNAARWTNAAIATHTVSVNHSPTTAVEPAGKVATTWADLKR